LLTAICLMCIAQAVPLVLAMQQRGGEVMELELMMALAIIDLFWWLRK